MVIKIRILDEATNQPNEVEKKLKKNRDEFVIKTRIFDVAANQSNEIEKLKKKIEASGNKNQNPR